MFDPVVVKKNIKKTPKNPQPRYTPSAEIGCSDSLASFGGYLMFFFGTHVLVLCCNMNDISICSVESYLVNAAYFGCNQ